MIDEGYIKFNCRWIEAGAVERSDGDDINHVRNRLFELGLIGVYEDGIGFGNVSVRSLGEAKFIISGTQTGGIPVLNESHYTRVLQYDLTNNSLLCKGPVKASSESLTHAALYEAGASAKAILHIHHDDLWKKLLNQIPTTSKYVPYGTPEMALEIKRLFRETNLLREKILVMAGHPGGIISFGENPKEAAASILRYF